MGHPVRFYAACVGPKTYIVYCKVTAAVFLTGGAGSVARPCPALHDCTHAPTYIYASLSLELILIAQVLACKQNRRYTRVEVNEGSAAELDRRQQACWMHVLGHALVGTSLQVPEACKQLWRLTCVCLVEGHNGAGVQAPALICGFGCHSKAQRNVRHAVDDHTSVCRCVLGDACQA